MTWNLDNNRPIYLQLMERIQREIIAGRYRPGERLPSVRELALEASVNPNTMQKALAELERKGLVYSRRISGRFLTEDPERIRALKWEEAAGCVREFVETMRSLGLEAEEIRSLLDNEMKEEVK